MVSLKKSLSCLFSFLMLLALVSFPVFADNAVEVAKDITDKTKIEISGGQNVKTITDKSDRNRISLPAGSTINITSEEEIYGLYIIWDNMVDKWDLTLNSDKNVSFDKNQYLHDYVNLTDISEKAAKQLEIKLSDKETTICEIYLLSKGTPPDWVQRWNPPYDKVDLMLFSTHADDEHLFFAGILPYYAGEVKARVQVVYFTTHAAGPNKNANRPHELLNGLWAVGIKAYPVISDFPDLYATSLKGAQTAFKGVKLEEDDFVKYQVEMVRRFKPQVIVGHDINGEYGHGAHMLNTLTLQKALEVSADPAKFPESAEEYGAFDVPKTYLHMWKENPVVMDWDKPLASFGGQSAFEISKKGYDAHKSQHYTWFTQWLNGTTKAPITKASQIKKYSPTAYGLYRSLVGADVAKNDFMENITLYKEPEPTVTETEPTQTTSALPLNATSPTAPPDSPFAITGDLIFGPLVMMVILLIIVAVFSSKRKRKF